MLFMLAYYRLPGLLADVALLIYALITFSLFRAVPVTLTLAGIAGFILSIGMAVDANVLIFARLREELRTGKTLRTAVEAGFDHAWPSIRDSNITTIITTAILYWFGSFFGASIIKGFALTLFLGEIISMFTAVLVTRTLLRLVMDTNLAHNQWWFGHDEAQSPTAPPPTESGTQPLR
jgi:preprotein translocase subunit SecD